MAHFFERDDLTPTKPKSKKNKKIGESLLTFFIIGSIFNKIERLHHDLLSSYITEREIRECLEEVIEETKRVRFSDTLLEAKKEAVVMKLINSLKFAVSSGRRLPMRDDLEEIKKIFLSFKAI